MYPRKQKKMVLQHVLSWMLMKPCIYHVTLLVT